MKRIQHFTHQELIKLIDQVPGMVYQFKMDTNKKISFTFVSKGILQFGGSLDDLDGNLNTVMGYLNPGEYKRFVDSILYSAEHLTEWNEEFRYNHPEKGPSWIKGQSFPEKQSDGSIIWNGHLKDITEEKLMEISLKQAIEMRDSFISIASHELKTPIAVLLMQLQMIQKKYQNVEGLSQDMNRAISQIDRINRQINNFFDSSKDPDESPFENEAYDLSESIKTYVNTTFFEFLQNGLEVEFDLVSGLYTKLSKDKIFQILSNVISNSIKYAPRSKVIISLKRVDTCLVLSVADSGPGIPEILLPNIFNRYQKSGNEFSISGIGLGLFVTKRLADFLRARIELQTGAGKGTLIRLSFPGEYFFLKP